jgi:transcription-repair coupling factor (superfamily II helicase)
LSEPGVVRILEEAAAAAPFRRLLGAAGPVRTGVVTGAGQPFVAAALAQAMDAPVLVVALDPRLAESFAAGAAGFLGPDRVVTFPAWESLAYEGISPGAQVAGRRARAAYLLRRASGPWVFVAPVVAAL